MFKYRTLTDFLKDETAVGTVMALFWFIICAGIVGLSVDTSNAWRQKERLQLTADVASHSGVVEMLAGGSVSDVRLAAHNSVLSNMPNSGFGRVIDTDINDIIMSDYDNSDNSLSEPISKMNAVTVQLHRNDTVDNPVGTYLLQFVGFSSWEVTRFATTAWLEWEDCPMYEGIFAHGYINSNDDNLFGPEFCVHSQTEVQLPQDTTWEGPPVDPVTGLCVLNSYTGECTEGSYMGMPSLKKCLDTGKCDDTANDGVEDAMHEINLQMPTFDEMVMQSYSEMIEQDISSGALVLNDRQAAFWDGKSVDQGRVVAEWDNLFPPSLPDPSSAGYQPPAKGTLVELTVAEFEAIDNPPSGLTYKVNCNPNGNGVHTFLDMLPTAAGDPVRDIVVLTNCSIEFHDDSDWRGVMVVSTRERANATVKASSGASVGDPTKSCDPNDQSYIFARSDMQVAAEFAASNIVFMAGDDVSIASGTSGEVDHHGMTVYSDGNVKLTTNHNYYACGNPPDLDVIGIPTFKYIKQVMPINESARL